MRMFARQHGKNIQYDASQQTTTEKNVIIQETEIETSDGNNPNVEKSEGSIAGENDIKKEEIDATIDTSNNDTTENIDKTSDEDNAGDTIIFDDDDDENSTAIDNGDEQIFGGSINFDDDDDEDDELHPNVDDVNIEIPEVNVEYSVDDNIDDVSSDELDDNTSNQEINDEEVNDFVPREHYEHICNELDTLEKRHQILLSDWENYKTRTANDVERAKRIACSELAVDVLPVLDDIERAISHARGSDQVGIADGLMSIYKKALGVYAKHGIERVYPKGEVFDIEKHMAVSRINVEEASVDEGMVEQVLQCGYVMGDVVLRPAMVTVAC